MGIAPFFFFFFSLFASGSGWANMVSWKRVGGSRLLYALYAELFV